MTAGGPPLAAPPTLKNLLCLAMILALGLVRLPYILVTKPNWIILENEQWPTLLVPKLQFPLPGKFGLLARTVVIEIAQTVLSKLQSVIEPKRWPPFETYGTTDNDFVLVKLQHWMSYSRLNVWETADVATESPHPTLMSRTLESNVQSCAQNTPFWVLYGWMPFSTVGPPKKLTAKHGADNKVVEKVP